MFIDEYTRALNDLMERKRKNSMSPLSPVKSQERQRSNNVQDFVRRQTLQGELENQILNLLDKGDHTKTKKELLVRTQNLLSRSQSPVMNRESYAEKYSGQNTTDYNSKEKTREIIRDTINITTTITQN